MHRGRTVHYREYLIEGAGLGLFMLSAATMASLIEHPSSPVRLVMTDAFTRRVLMGVAMGVTAAALVYSPWGRRSGAHFNPSVTFTFYRLGKVSRTDAVGYVTAQFAGGVLGIAGAAGLLWPWIADAHVNYVATLPGPRGDAVAFAGELAISFLLMLTVLTVSNRSRLARFTGLFAAALVASFITVEAPLSGMSMNPARTLGPSLVGGPRHGLWLYFVAPPLGMLAAAELYVRLNGRARVGCPKLQHALPCIFCEQDSYTRPPCITT